MTATSARPGALVTWCRLLRVPNLFTVPGDVLAGYLLATGGRLDWPALGGVVAMVLVYMAGLLLNDYFDRKKDAEERPERPIPSGAADATTVLGVGLVFVVAGCVVAWGTGGLEPGIVAVLVAVAALAYDTGLKEIPFVGPLTMGACRAGSVVVGSALAGGLGATAPTVVAGVTGVYTLTVTVLAAREASGARLQGGAYLPAGVLALGAVVVLVAAEPTWSTGIVALFFLAVGVFRICVAADQVQRVQIGVPVYIGVAIRVMVFAQVAWCLWYQPQTLPQFAVVAAGFAVLFAGAELLSRRFDGS